MREAWLELRRQGVRRRDAAAQLGVSEAELVQELARAGEGVRLRPEWPALLVRIPTLGGVMALTRNEACVIEKTGVYGMPDFASAQLGQVTGPDIDLRLFLNHWSYGFALAEEGKRSLEFFAPDGRAVHKIHARGETDLQAWDALVAEFTDESDELAIAPNVRAAERPDADVDVDAYRAALAGMDNTHDFFGVMRRFWLTREQALRLGGPQFAQPVDRRSYRRLLLDAADSGISIMAFVGNQGAIEIHTGPVHRVIEHDGYFNVLDRTFNLHLRENLVERTWVVRKPTKSGLISSLEVFDASGEMIAQFFGERHRNEAERKEWRSLLAEMQPLEQFA